MDSLLEKVYSIQPEEIPEYRENLMIGGGSLGGPCLASGKGIRVKDINGKEYIDCTSQSWALYLGHGNEEIRETVHEHMGMAAHIHQGFDTLPRFALAKKLAELAPKNLNRVSFTVGGGPAIEAAMKIALKNTPGARRFLTLKDAYHGTTLSTAGASWISTKAAGEYTGYQNFSRCLNDIFTRIPNPYLYRWDMTDNPEDCIDYCLKVARDTIVNGVCGPVAGIIVEPIQASGGQIPLPKRYLQGLRDLCDEMGCLLIFDEIQTYCRIGSFFAANYYDVEPDIICLGKALGAGFPIAAVIIHDRLKGFEPNGEELHTFANNSVSQIAALKQIEIIERDNLLENTNVVGKHIADRLAEMQKEIPQIGDIRQVGLHIGIEMVEDPKTKEPLKKAGEIKKKAQENGMILGTGGFRKNILKIKPPMITTIAEADEICDLFYKTLKEVL